MYFTAFGWLELAKPYCLFQMEEAKYQWLIPTSIILLLFLHFLSKFILQRSHRNYKNLPPSPPRFPIIGHLHLLKKPLHRSLHEISKKYGKILYLQFGTRKVLLVSSAPAVEDCFANNDVIFANRPLTLAGKHLNYNNKVVGFASYGNFWRNLRRLMTLEILSSHRLAMFTGIREDEVRSLIKQIFEESRERFSKVELKTRSADLSFNIMVRMISGKRYYGKDAVGNEGMEFQSFMKEAMELDGSGNLNDFFPILQWVDFNGLEKRMKKLMSRMDKFFQNLLDEKRMNRSVMSGSNNERKMTLIEVMLHLQQTEPKFYTDETMKGIILAMLLAGTETSSTALEWALSLLLNHPEAMKKVRDELDNNVGQDRMINESDLPKLPYLQNVITETLRLFPVAPLLVPHESSNDCNVCGFDVPRGTMLFVNLWSLHRDADLWEDPTRFVPERFEGKEGGEAFNMIPFGAGRRACPGDKLAKRVIGMTLGALIQCFEWKRIGEEEIDMVEGEGITIPKVEPLVAMCKPRKVMESVLSNLSSM